MVTGQGGGKGSPAVLGTGTKACTGMVYGERHRSRGGTVTTAVDVLPLERDAPYFGLGSGNPRDVRKDLSLTPGPPSLKGPPGRKKKGLCLPLDRNGPRLSLAREQKALRGEREGEDEASFRDTDWHSRGRPSARGASYRAGGVAPLEFILPGLFQVSTTHRSIC